MGSEGPFHGFDHDAHVREANKVFARQDSSRHGAALPFDANFGKHEGVLGLTLLAPLLLSAEPGHLEPKPLFKGPRLSGPCEVEVLRARPEEETERHRGPAPLAVSAGRWQVLLHCPDPSGTLIPVPGPKVDVVSGRHHRPPVKVLAAALRIEPKRNGRRCEAEVEARLPGLDAAVFTFASGQTRWVGRGSWRFRVTAESAVNTVGTPKWRKGRKVAVVGADLSDGRLAVEVRRGRKRVDGVIRVYDARDRPGSPAATGRPLALPPGEHRVEVALADAADFAKRLQTVIIAPRRTTPLLVRFEAGWIAADIRRDGKRPDAEVHLARPGAGRAFNRIDNGSRALVRPGRYRLWVEGPLAGPSGRHELGNVDVVAERTARVRADLSPARLEVDVVGSPPRELRLLEAGGGREVPPVGPGRWRPWAGRYELELELEDGSALTDGPFEVRLGANITRTVVVERPEMTVTVARGGANVRGAQVRIYRPGGAEPLTEMKAGQKAALPPGRYDVRAAYGPDVGWRRGVVLRKPTRIVVELEVPTEGLPEGELPEGELPAGDAR